MMNVLKLLFPNMQIKMGNMETIYQSNGYKYKNKLKLSRCRELLKIQQPNGHVFVIDYAERTSSLFQVKGNVFCVKRLRKILLQFLEQKTQTYNSIKLSSG
jgi:hypothetical protein